MEVAVESLSDLRKSLKITLPKEIVEARLEAAYHKLQSQVSLKGFRKGKTPLQVVKKTFSDRVQNEVSEELIKETYFDALSQVKLEVVVHPDIKAFAFGGDGGFSYQAEVEIKPEFTLGAYKGIEVEHPEVTVSEEEIDRALEATRRELAPLRAVTDRPVKQDDLIVIDFQGYEGEKPLPHVGGHDYPVDIGSKRHGQEFEEALIGLGLNEESSREVAFPADFANTILAGKTVRFQVTVKGIKERVLPDLDDNFAKDVNETFSSLTELRASIADKIRQGKEKTRDGDLADKVMHKLVAAHDFPLPARLVAYEIDTLAKDFEANLERQNLNLEVIGLSRETLAENFKEAAERRVKGDFILKKIAEVEGIKLSNDDIANGYQRIANQYGMKVSEVKEYFQGRNNLLPFMNELLNEKIVAFLRESARVSFTPAQDTEASA